MFLPAVWDKIETLKKEIKDCDNYKSYTCWERYQNQDFMKLNDCPHCYDISFKIYDLENSD